MAKTKATTPATEKAPKKKAKPTQDDIALRAYFISLERGGSPGNPMEDWLRAERELTGAVKAPRKKSKVISIAA